jgi:GalNAc-alpha-(1->4)-GalNAc-alpha-(1->3)-diNAcBac-PP-undecaprenol alpha-1,4-N-acetyl-D-galactosaminyltransferase
VTKNKKSFCFLIHSLSPGGMERVMAELLIYFSSKPGLQLHLVLFGHKRELFYNVPDNVIIHKPSFEFSNRFRFRHTLKTIFFLRRKVKNIKPDAILSFGEYWNNLVLLALYGLKYPVYISDRSSPLKNIGRFHSFLRKWLYPKAAGLIAQTHKAGEIAKKEKRNKNITVIGNPIREIKFDLAEKRQNIVLTVGRLIKTKNLDRLIRIFASIHLPGWKLVIVGGDAKGQDQLKELKALVKNLDAENIIEFAGYQKDIDSYYRRSKIFAFTSSSEGFPNVVGEALSEGLPVVSYDCVSGPSEMIENGKNGFLVPLFNDSLFLEKLKLLMESENLRETMALNAKVSLKKFNAETIGEQYYTFLTEKLNS